MCVYVCVCATVCVSNSEAQLSKYTSISAAQSCPLLVSIRYSVPVVCLPSPLLLPAYFVHSPFSLSAALKCVLCVSILPSFSHRFLALWGLRFIWAAPPAFPHSHNLLTSCLPLVYRYLCLPSSHPPPSLFLLLLLTCFVCFLLSCGRRFHFYELQRRAAST